MAYQKNSAPLQMGPACLALCPYFVRLICDLYFFLFFPFSLSLSLFLFFSVDFLFLTSCAVVAASFVSPELSIRLTNAESQRPVGEIGGRLQEQR